MNLKDFTWAEILSLLISLTLELCPPWVSRDCLDGVRLLTLTIMTMNMTWSTDLLPPQISLNKHKPAGPVGMSLTLDFFFCLCPWHLQSKLRSPAFCYLEKSRIQRQPLHPAAFTLSGSFKRDFFKASGQCHWGIFQKFVGQLLDTPLKQPCASNS